MNNRIVIAIQGILEEVEKENLKQPDGSYRLRDGLIDTPQRVAKMYGEIFDGYGKDPEAALERVFGKSGDIRYRGLVLEANIPFISWCEHHMAMFKGLAHIGYLPDDCVAGLSKIPRVVDIFAHRLQVQERLTNEIADALQLHLKPRGCMVVLEAEHSCMFCRGIKKDGIITVTNSLRGDFETDASLKAEFMTTLQMVRRNV